MKMKMIGYLLFVFLAIAVIVYAPTVHGQEDIKGFTFSGFVDASYLYDRNADSNSFSLDQAEIDVTKEIKDRASLRVDINYINTGAALTTDDILEQGYLTLTCVCGLQYTFGKFNAPIGFELLDPVDMYQYSHSLVFDNGLPTNLTGFMISRSFADMIDINVYIVNGWDNINDNNKGKTFGGRIGVAPVKGINFGISGISGPEGDNDVTEKTSVLDIDGTIAIVPDMTLGMEFNWGWEDRDVVSDGKWFGLLFMAHYDYTKWGGFTFRYDYFDDDGNADRLGNGGFDQQAITFSPTFVIADGFGALIEYRHDFSTADNFIADNDTVAFEMTYSF